MMEHRWKTLMLLSMTLAFVNFSWAASVPLYEESAGESVGDDKYPVMVPVSSTVIPLLNLFGKLKPLQGGGVTPKPRSHAAASTHLSPARRMRLLERSRRPEEPVRLITKNSKQKDMNNETH